MGRDGDATRCGSCLGVRTPASPRRWGEPVEIEAAVVSSPVVPHDALRQVAGRVVAEARPVRPRRRFIGACGEPPSRHPEPVRPGQPAELRLQLGDIIDTEPHRERFDGCLATLRAERVDRIKDLFIRHHCAATLDAQRTARRPTAPANPRASRKNGCGRRCIPLWPRTLVLAGGPRGRHRVERQLDRCDTLVGGSNRCRRVGGPPPRCTPAPVPHSVRSRSTHRFPLTRRPHTRNDPAPMQGEGRRAAGRRQRCNEQRPSAIPGHLNAPTVTSIEALA
jgi:hypothetical protein